MSNIFEASDDEKTREYAGKLLTAETQKFGRFLKLQDVCKSVGLSRASVYRFIQSEEFQFPKPVKLGTASRWIESEVREWKADMVERMRQ